MRRKITAMFYLSIICALMTGCGNSERSPSNSQSDSTKNSSSTTISISTTAETTTQQMITSLINSETESMITESISESSNDSVSEKSNIDYLNDLLTNVANRNETITVLERATQQKSSDYYEKKGRENYISKVSVDDVNVSFSFITDSEGLYEINSSLERDNNTLEGVFWEVYNSYKKNKNINQFQGNMVDKKTADQINRKYLNKQLSAIMLIDEKADMYTVEDLAQKIMKYIENYPKEIPVQKSAVDGEEYKILEIYFKYNDDFYVYQYVSIYDDIPIFLMTSNAIVSNRDFENLKKLSKELGSDMPEVAELK
ncbi:MAG: hypothetical protein IKN17_09150 [Ruminococcus sp.]|nr:hypothetical protein [Ruminococcus sp.]